MLDILLLRLFLPLLNKIFGDRDGIAFTQEHVRKSLCPQRLIFGIIVDRLRIRLENFLIDRRFLHLFHRVKFAKIINHAKSSIRDRGFRIQLAKVFLRHLDFQKKLFIIDLFFFQTQLRAGRVIAHEHVALVDGLSLGDQYFLDHFRIRKIDVLLRVCSDHAGHTILPIQILSVIQFRGSDDHDGRGRCRTHCSNNAYDGCDAQDQRKHRSGDLFVVFDQFLHFPFSSR